MKVYEYKITATRVAESPAKVLNSKSCYDFLKPIYEPFMLIQEGVYILLLDNANNIKGYAEISKGGMTGTVVDVRIIMKYAIDQLASGIVLAHNHPSGNLKESAQDRLLTKKIQAACEVMDIALLDHIILTENSYTSFSDKGLL